jgi:iron complex outermembrane receptor protein
MNRHSNLYRKLNKTLIKSAFTCGFLGMALAAQAQTSVEEIIITADFRRNTLNDMAASVSVLDEQLIASKNALHLEDILSNAPNVNFASGASRARFYQIRGIGERGQYSEVLNPSVGVLIDGVDFSGIGGAAMLYDVEQVEILMGPQGTRYGSNALAGLINLQSKSPAQEAEYGLQLQQENFGGTGMAGYISGALAPTLLGRIAVQKSASDGFMHNLTLDKSTNNRDESTVRGKLHWQASAEVSADLTLALIDIDNGYDAFSLDNNRETLSDEPGFDTQISRLTSLQFNIDTFDVFTLQVITGLANSDIGYGYDEDWTRTNFHPWEYASTDHYFRDHNTLSAEIRALSKDSSGLFNGRTSWITGLYALDQQVDMEREYTYLPGTFNNSYDIARTAFYADTSTTLNAALTLEAGMRIENIVASYGDSSALAFHPSDVLLGGRLALNYQFNDNQMVYASMSRGYKTGGFNTDGSLDPDLREFDEETLWNYEAGFKGSLFDDSLRTQVAFFYMDRDDVQISSSTTRVRNDGSAEFIAYTGNAAAGVNSGVELGVQWLSNERVTMYGNLGLLKSEYKDFVNSEGDNLDGRQQAHAPDYQYTIGTSVMLLPLLSLDLNLQAKDAFYFSDSHSERSGSYALINASLLWEWNQLDIRVWGRNLLDKDYSVRGFYFGNDPRDGYTAKSYTQLGEPLRYGVTLNVDF